MVKLFILTLVYAYSDAIWLEKNCLFCSKRGSNSYKLSINTLKTYCTLMQKYSSLFWLLTQYNGIEKFLVSFMQHQNCSWQSMLYICSLGMGWNFKSCLQVVKTAENFNITLSTVVIKRTDLKKAVSKKINFLNKFFIKQAVFQKGCFHHPGWIICASKL